MANTNRVNQLQKVVRDGKVAVLYSPGFGAGWYTWNSEHRELLFAPSLVALVEESAPEDQIVAEAEKLVPDGYFGGASDLTIAWLPEGAPFRVEEYDGSESITLESDLFIVA